MAEPRTTIGPARELAFRRRRPRFEEWRAAPSIAAPRMARSRVWIARRLADGAILAAWNQAPAPDAATAIPGQSAATIDILEVPVELVRMAGGPAAFVRRFAGGFAYSDAAEQLIALVSRAERAAVSAIEGGGLAFAHGLLAGLGDDDHPQYLPLDGSRAMTGRLSTHSDSGSAGMNLPSRGGDPAVVADGDFWVKSNGLYMRSNGASVGIPLLLNHLGGTPTAPTVVNHAAIASDLHTVYLLVSGTRGMTGALSLAQPDASVVSLKFPDEASPPTSPVAGDLWRSGSILNWRTAGGSTRAIAQIAGQLGGTGDTPDVRGVRETGGPTLLTMGAVADGNCLARSGSTIAGAFPRDLSAYRQVGTSPVEAWYHAGQVTARTGLAGGVAIDNMYALPFVSRRAGTLDRIAFEVTTLASKGVGRAGIYQTTSDTNLYPNALVVDGGELATTTTGVKAATISTALAADTLYWMVVLFGTAAPSVRALLVDCLLAIFGASSSFGNDTRVGFSFAQTYGALPSTFPSGKTPVAAAMPMIGVRYSA